MIDFEEYYNQVLSIPTCKVWSRGDHVTILQYEEQEVYYHVTFNMYSREYQKYEMKKSPWVNGQGFSLEIKRRVYA